MIWGGVAAVAAGLVLLFLAWKTTQEIGQLDGGDAVHATAVLVAVAREVFWLAGGSLLLLLVGGSLLLYAVL